MSFWTRHKEIIIYFDGGGVLENVAQRTDVFPIPGKI